MDHGDADLKQNAWIDADTEDELSISSKLSRVTPRSSVAGRASPTAQKPTPHATLRQLAAIVRKPSTPRRRASSIGAPPSQGHVTPHPPNLSRTPSTRLPLQPARGDRSNPTTPHVIRALQQRRATPGRDRRKSGRLQRETPRDALRQLSRILAPISQPLKPSPPAAQPQSNKPERILNEDFDDELDLPQPRFSIAIDDGISDDDSFQEVPPRLSMPMNKADQTGRSTEIGRRAISEQPLGRLSRGRFGSIDASDLSGLTDVSQPRIDDSIMDKVLDLNADELGDLGGGSDLGGDTEDLRRAIFENSDRRKSQYRDLQPNQQLDTDALSPFILNIPNIDPREASPFVAHPDEPFDDVDDPQCDEIRNPQPRLKSPIRVTKLRNGVSKPPRRSRHGASYPNLPPRITKRIASTFIQSLGNKKTSLGKETLKAITDASDQYFEQFSEDLGAFANHAGRKQIDESDAIAVMKRQRLVSATSTAFSLAHKHLPGELLQDMRIPPPKARPQRGRRRLEVINEDEDEAEDH